MLVVGPLTNLGQLVPVVVLVLITGRSGDLSQVWYALGGAGIVVLAGVVRWRTTRYRITAERVELHTGLLRRQRRSVPRDRIRTVDLTASPVHRDVRAERGAGGVGDGRGLGRRPVGPARPRRREHRRGRAPAPGAARSGPRPRRRTRRRRPSSPTCTGRGCASRR